MPDELLRREREGPAAVITLNRPERRNALSLEMLRELLACLAEVGRDADARVVILAAAGKVFSSGHDLSEMIGREEEDYRLLFRVCTEVMAALAAIPQPVIAEVQGLATAAGCQLVAACDLAVASGEARFATPGVKIGLFCTTPMTPLVRAIGRKRAMEMLLTGRPIDAHTAAAWGLVNRVVPPDRLRAETLALAAEIAGASPYTVALGKRAFHEQADLPQSDAYARAQEVMTRNAMVPDAQEGMKAFLEKRAPQWGDAGEDSCTSGKEPIPWEHEGQSLGERAGDDP